MLAIQLPQSIEKRLERLARRTGRTKTYYVREAILEHLEDIEDLYLAEGALERIRTGREPTIPLRDVMKRHGVKRRVVGVRGPGTRQARRTTQDAHSKVPSATS